MGGLTIATCMYVFIKPEVQIEVLEVSSAYMYYCATMHSLNSAVAVLHHSAC